MGIKRYHDMDVLAAARKRISDTFDDFPRIYVGFSGGKDSSVMLHLVMEEAVRRNRRVAVMFIDFEAQYSETIIHVEEMFERYKEHIEPHWICMPMLLRNAVTNYEPRWVCWDEEKKSVWVRDKPESAHTEKDYPFAVPKMEFEEFVVLFGEWYGQGERTAGFIGIRAQESLHRYCAVATWEKRDLAWRGRRWTTNIVDKVYNVYPIYDWLVEDIWRYHAKYPEQPHNRIYDRMQQAGVKLSQQRLCQPFGDDQRRGLWLYHILEPGTWAKLVSRVNGANSGALYVEETGNVSGYNKITLPPGHTWKSFCNLLLQTMPKKTCEHYVYRFKKFIWGWRQRGYMSIPDEAPPELEAKCWAPSWRRMCKVLLRNDYWCKGLGQAQPKSEAYQTYKAIKAARLKEKTLKEKTPMPVKTPATSPQPRPRKLQDAVNELVFMHGKNLRNQDYPRIQALQGAGLDPARITDVHWDAAASALDRRIQAEASGRRLVWEFPPQEVDYAAGPGLRWASSDGHYRVARMPPSGRARRVEYGAECRTGGSGWGFVERDLDLGPGYGRYYDSLEDAARACERHLLKQTALTKINHNLTELLQSEAATVAESEPNPLEQKLDAARREHPGMVIAFRADGGYEFYGSDARLVDYLTRCGVVPYHGMDTTAVPDEEWDRLLEVCLDGGHVVAVVDEAPEDEIPSGTDLPVRQLHGTMAERGDDVSPDATVPQGGELPPEETAMVAAVEEHSVVEGPPATQRVRESAVRALFVACEWNASKWDLDKLQKKINEKVLTTADRFPAKGSEEMVTFQAITGAYEEGIPVEVVTDADWEAAHAAPARRGKGAAEGNGHGGTAALAVEAAAPAPAKRGKGRPKGSKSKPKESAEKTKVPAVKGRAVPSMKSRGVLDAIAEIISAATKAAPAYPKDILKVLVKRFPDRPELGLSRTLASAKWHMRERLGKELKRTDDGGMYFGR